jgi:hypothetical protein
MQTNSATLAASCPTTTFAGMIAPEKPPLRIANSTSWASSLRTSKFGPSVRSLYLTFPGALEPRAAAALSVWQPLQRWLKSSAPACCAGAVSILSPHPPAMTASAAAMATSTGWGRDTGAHIIRRPCAGS